MVTNPLRDLEIFTKVERRKRTERINTMTTNSKQIKNLQMTTWNVHSLYRLRDLRITINEPKKYKIEIAAIQVTEWSKSTPQAFSSNGYTYNIYTSNSCPSEFKT
jgi:hypothetical protein